MAWWKWPAIIWGVWKVSSRAGERLYEKKRKRDALASPPMVVINKRTGRLILDPESEVNDSVEYVLTHLERV